MLVSYIPEESDAFRRHLHCYFPPQKSSTIPDMRRTVQKCFSFWLEEKHPKFKKTILRKVGYSLLISMYVWMDRCTDRSINVLVHLCMFLCRVRLYLDLGIVLYCMFIDCAMCTKSDRYKFHISNMYIHFIKRVHIKEKISK